jgi:hypothetical protein
MIIQDLEMGNFKMLISMGIWELCGKVANIKMKSGLKGNGIKINIENN